MSDTAIAELFGRDRSTISREIRLYLKAKEFEIDEKDYKHVPDRTMMRALELQDKLDFKNFVKVAQMFPEIEWTRLVSIINGTLTIEKYREQLQEKYQKELDALDRLEEYLKNDKLLSVKIKS
jgi:hypothetical protein